MFGKCLEGVWMGSAGCLKGILRVSMVHPKGMWGVYIYLKGKSGLVKSGKVESLQVRSGKVKSGQVKSRQVKLSQDRSSLILAWDLV